MRTLIYIVLLSIGIYNQSFALDELTARLGSEGIVNLVILIGGAYLIQKLFSSKKKNNNK